MPSSTYKIINQTIEEILKTNPKSILEVGIGFGKYGFLAREYLETWKDNVFPNQWQIKIDGIEIFEPYTDLPHMKGLYNNIHVGNAYHILKNNGFNVKYDLCIAMDVIEHMFKDQGVFVAKELINISNKKCIINVPTGNWMNNVVIAGNEAEQHRAIWEPEDFDKLSEEIGIKGEKIIWEQNRRKGCLAIFKK